MHKALSTLLLLALTACSPASDTPHSYRLHQDITATVFWSGESASSANGHIPNLASAWDDLWMLHYGGVDDPDHRKGYRPATFAPMENPFYVALPYNDFDAQGRPKADRTTRIPWAPSHPSAGESLCKNRWVAISRGKKTAYAQWEDVGPFGEDDAAYVFGTASPKSAINQHAGIDLSPAVRDYLGVDGMGKVSWHFVDEADVPDGPWLSTVTQRPVTWVDWYRPETSSTWQWQLQGDLNSSYNVSLYDIDLFDSSTETIHRLHAAGRKVICYFSAGSYEEWRSDAAALPASTRGKALDGWAGERWLDIRNEALHPVMTARLDLAVSKGCDGVEPDNVDGHSNDTGFPLTATDQYRYNTFVANAAHDRGLAVGLKNDLDQIPQLLPFYDFALNEQCHEFGECDKLQPFVAAGKPIFVAEYATRYRDDASARDALCSRSRQEHFHTLVLPLDLNGSFRYSCDP